MNNLRQRMLVLRNEFADLTLSLSIIGFTNDKDELLDAKIEVKQGKNTFTNSGSFFEAEEIRQIDEWFRGIFRSNSGYTTDLYFNNSHISFHYIASTEKAIVISVRISTEDISDFKIDQALEESFSDYLSNMKEIAEHRSGDPYKHENHLYFAVKWEEIPGIRQLIKSTSQEFPPFRNEEDDFLEDYEPKKLPETGKFMELINDLNDLTFKMISFGFARDRDDDPDDDWVITRLEVAQGKNKYYSTGEHLQSYEIWSILDWFKTLSKRRLPHKVSLHFLEPNISFHFLEATRKWVLIGIELGVESELDFLPRQFHPNDLDLFTREELVKSESYNFHQFREKMIFNLTLSDFKVIIEQLEAIMAGLPEPQWIHELQRNTNNSH